MVDLALSVTVTRTALALPDLQINDHIDYYIGTSFFGGTMSWTRNQVGSPFIDGMVTAYRNKQMVTEPVQVECLGDDAVELAANIATLYKAFMQDDFNVSIAFNGVTYTYQCEAADVTMLWTGPRLIANQGQVNFSVPRQPNPLVGVI